MTKSKISIRKMLVNVIMAAVIVVSMTSVVKADTWRGTAPFCDGECLPGEKQIAVSDHGDGATCWSGHKVLCQNASPTCAAKQTKAKCYGIIEICDNGHYEINGVWTSCSKYWCGFCFGFGEW